MSAVSPTVAELGEHEVLRRLHRFCAPIVGDDGAVQALPKCEQLVVTTDVLVDGVHFCDRTLPPDHLGWRAAAVNLSDLAAMGATPLGLTVGLTVPPETPWRWLESLYQGLVSCLERHGGSIIGGDLCRGDRRSLAITALGSVLHHRALYRNRAQAGHRLVATGVHGASRAGLALLLGELEGSDHHGQAWIEAHQRPIPRFDAISILRGFNLKDGQTMAAMDTSDGLADAVIQICNQSNIGARLRRSQLPVPPGLAAVVGAETAENWTLYGGEDFELVLSLPVELAEAFVDQLPGSHVIGHVTATAGVVLVDDVDQGPDIQLQQSLGYQHFG